MVSFFILMVENSLKKLTVKIPSKINFNGQNLFKKFNGQILFKYLTVKNFKLFHMID